MRQEQLAEQKDRVLRFVCARLDASGVAPSFNEIQSELGIRSRSVMGDILFYLQRDGYLRRLPRKARAIELLKRPPVRCCYFKWDNERKELVPWP